MKISPKLKAIARIQKILEEFPVSERFTILSFVRDEAFAETSKAKIAASEVHQGSIEKLRAVGEEAGLG